MRTVAFKRSNSQMGTNTTNTAIANRTPRLSHSGMR